MFVLKRRAGDALAQIRDGFRDGSHALFVFRRKKKRAQEWTVNAVAKGKPGSAHALQQIFRERGHTQKRGFQNNVPFLCARRRQNRTWRSTTHFISSRSLPGTGSWSGPCLLSRQGSPPPPRHSRAYAAPYHPFPT